MKVEVKTQKLVLRKTVNGQADDSDITNEIKMTKPIEVLENWIAAFNRADIETISALYADDAINHQVANDPVIGKSAIRQMFANEFALAEMTCIPENIFQDGEIGRAHV